jgi:cytochrome b6-f complex iron-sulfur subunit
MKRRSFLGWVGVGAIASSLPMAIAACSNTSESASTDNTSAPETASSTTETTATADGFEDLGAVAELDEKGFLMNTVSDKEVIAIRNPDNTETVIALNALCTHKGCAVDWKGQASEFSCGCHGSKFAVDGTATHGPATAPLANYQAKIEGDRVWVNVG